MFLRMLFFSLFKMKKVSAGLLNNLDYDCYLAGWKMSKSFRLLSEPNIGALCLIKK